MAKILLISVMFKQIRQQAEEIKSVKYIDILNGWSLSQFLYPQILSDIDMIQNDVWQGSIKSCFLVVGQ